MEIEDFDKKIKEFTHKIEGSFKTIEEKKKFQDALNNPDIQNRVNKAMEAIKKTLSND